MSPRDCRSYRALMVTPEGNCYFCTNKERENQSGSVPGPNSQSSKSARLQSMCWIKSSELSCLWNTEAFTWQNERKILFLPQYLEKDSSGYCKVSPISLSANGALGMARMREALKTQSVQNELWVRMWCLRTGSRAKTLHMNIK